MGKLEISQPDNHDAFLLQIARELFYDSISLEKVKGLTEMDKEKIKYYYTCLEQGNDIGYISTEENTIKMAA